MLSDEQIEETLEPLRYLGEWCRGYSVVVGVIGDSRTVSERPRSYVLAEANFLRSLIDQSDSREEYLDTIAISEGTVLSDFTAVGPVLHASSKSCTPDKVIQAIRGKAVFGIGARAYGSAFLLSPKADLAEEEDLSAPIKVLRKFIRESCSRAQACDGGVLVVVISGGGGPSAPREWRRAFYDSMGFAFYDEALE